MSAITTNCTEIEPLYDPQYYLGRDARDRGFDVTACNIPTYRGEKRSWWLAGWADRDIELLGNGYHYK